MTGELIKLVVVDDYRKIRKSIINILKTEKDIEVVGEAANGKQAIKLAVSQKPDVMLLDIELPDQRGTMVMRQLHSIQPDLKVLAVSGYSDSQFVTQMKENGASGYITKDKISAMLVFAIRSVVLEGAKWVGLQGEKSKSHAPSEQTLTKREVEILKQLMQDHAVDLMAANLGMNERQVQTYLDLLMKKYQAASLPELKLIAGQIFPDINP